MTLDLVTDLGDKLMGNVKDEDGCVFDTVDNIGGSEDIVRKADTREIFDILMKVVDDGGELLWAGMF